MRDHRRLPSLGMVSAPEPPPSIEGARAALGGRAASGQGAGEIVRLPSGAVGVIVYCGPDESDVWVGEGRFVRAAGPLQGAPARAELEPVARDARSFAAIAEGDRVRCLDRDDRPHDGTLLEKCRYGALVLADEGRILAVSFRRVFAPDPSA